MTVLAADRWATNAHLIVSCRDLGYLDGHVLDPTYGKRKWWTLWTPEKFATHDLALDGVVEQVARAIANEERGR